MKFFLLFTWLLLENGAAFALSYFSKTSGNWNQSSTWVTTSCGGANTNSGTFPSFGDDVTICNGHTVTMTDYAECTNLTIASGGILTTANSNPSPDGWTLRVQTNCTVSGSINVDGKGSLGNAGTGAGTVTTTFCGGGSGGAYGGQGGPGVGSVNAGTYGSSSAPVNLGSGGGGYSGGSAGGNGGGVIRLIIDHTLTVNAGGSISANGLIGPDDLGGTGGGSGGSIYICAATFAGTGPITATGGDGGCSTFCSPCGGTPGGGGGGGRISIIVSSSDTYGGSITANGGSGNSYNNGASVTGTINHPACCTACSGVPLPIELLYFNALPNGNVVDLNWTTITETNNDFFTVERSKDGINFEKVTTVKGAGNSTEKLNYSAIDNDPYQGVSYYRLQQTDFDGKFTYSKTVAVSFHSDLFVSPNPINLIIDKNITLKLSGLSKESEVMVKFYDVLERTCFSKMLVTDGDGNSFVNIENNTFPASGVYLVSVLDDNQLLHKKVVVVE